MKTHIYMNLESTRMGSTNTASPAGIETACQTETGHNSRADSANESKTQRANCRPSAESAKYYSKSHTGYHTLLKSKPLLNITQNKEEEETKQEEMIENNEANT